PRATTNSAIQSATLRAGVGLMSYLDKGRIGSAALVVAGSSFLPAIMRGNATTDWKARAPDEGWGQGRRLMHHSDVVLPLDLCHQRDCRIARGCDLVHLGRQRAHGKFARRDSREGVGMRQRIITMACSLLFALSLTVEPGVAQPAAKSY